MAEPPALSGVPMSAAAAVGAALDHISREHRVAIPLAIESGSRAWGFPSLDSDYDCRFLFVRTPDQYLTLYPRRDVIELPIENDLDVNGWDIGKTLKLILKGNAVALEWLNSPLVYRREPEFRDILLDFARRFADRAAIRSHYLYLGRQQREAHLLGRDLVPLKKVFYVLRPAAALRWLRLHPQLQVPPMDLPTLMAESQCPAEVIDITQALIDRKAGAREMGEAPLPTPLASFIETEFTIASETARSRGTPIRQEAREEADALYRELVDRYAPSSNTGPG